MDLLLIRLEKIDNDFYESLIKFISDHGYSPKVVVRNTDILSFPGSSDLYSDCLGNWI